MSEPNEELKGNEPKREKVRIIPIELIDDFPDHPFQVKDDESMAQLVESIRMNGVLNPIILRKKEGERYEIIAGHRRKYACRKLDIKLIPSIVRELSREDAIIEMVDPNLQRECILPSEKARAYKMKMDAMKRKSGRPSKENSAPLEQNFGKTTRDMLAAESPDSSEQIRRYVRLTELTPELLEFVDEGKIGIVVAAVKGIVAAIVAGGWVAVLIIVIIVIVALVVGSMYAIFVPAEDSGITIYSVKTDLEREYHQRQAELIANCQYDILNYEGDIAAWDEMIAVYAVKLNFGDEPQEVATFDEDKASELKAIFWDMNSISLRTDSRTTTVTRYETDANGNSVEVQEEVTMIILTVVTDSMSADEISDEYGFSAKQDTMLDELLSEENAELWAGILGE